MKLGELVGQLDVRMVAGEDGLQRAIRWVHISEHADPTPWLSGGELLLSTGMNLTTPESQVAYVQRLSDHGLAGLGFGTGFSHDRVPEPLIAAAAQRGFPLFEIPYEVPFIALTEAASSHLVSESYAVLRRARAAHERLEQIVLAEHGLAAIVAALAELIDGAAIVFDPRGEPLAHAGAAAPLLAELGAELRERTDGGARRSYLPAAGPAERALALPVVQTPSGDDGRAPQAWLIGICDQGALSELQRLILHQAVTVVALELLRARVVADTERRLAGDVLGALVAGDLNGDELARRLAPFGLGERVGALVLAPALADRGDVERSILHALRDAGRGGLVAATDELVCALLPADAGDDELFALAERVRAVAAGAIDGPLHGGAGRAVAAADARRAYHEARCAHEAQMLGADGNAGRLATYHDLGSFQLLLALQDDDALRLFCDSILAPIEDGEGKYGGELMRSLEVFIESNGQWERAARKLYCHRHTLRYRMRRVEELSGRSIDSARDRIDFWLALRGRELTRRKP